MNKDQRLLTGRSRSKPRAKGICVAVRGHADALVVGIGAYGFCVGVYKDAAGNG